MKIREIFRFESTYQLRRIPTRPYFAAGHSSHSWPKVHRNQGDWVRGRSPRKDLDICHAPLANG